MAAWDGSSYRQVSDLQAWLAVQTLQDIVLEGGEQVLDVGCGDGRITAAIAGRLAGDGSILGIDPSPRMVGEAEGLCASAPTRFRFELGDVLTMDFEDGFDLVVSFNALHWVLDQRRALRRIRAALHGWGWALLQFVCRGERASLEQVAMRVSAAPSWRKYFPAFAAPFVHVDPDRYATLAGGAGLQVRDVDIRDLHWDFETPGAFARWCRVGFGAWTDRRLDDAAADGFVADVLDAYATITGSQTRFEFMQMRVRLDASG